MNEVEQFLKGITVYDCDFTKIRLGNPHDGGYIVLEEICKITPAVYSFGIGNDVGFELDFVKRFPATKFELFDPTIGELPKKHPNFEFSQKDVELAYSELRKAPINSLLKIDVEWNEWEALMYITEKELIKLSQLVIEFHMVHPAPPPGLRPYFYNLYQTALNSVTKDLFRKYSGVIAELNELFYCVHIHANNSLPKVGVMEYLFPPLLELTFVRKDLIVKARKTEAQFPIIGLDFPNKIDRPDIMNFYPFRKEPNAE